MTTRCRIAHTGCKALTNISRSLTNLTSAIDNSNRPRRASLETVTDAANPRKGYPAGSLLWTYLEIINIIYYADTPLDVQAGRPWVRGCINGFECTYYNLDQYEQPPNAVIAWGIIGVIAEQFRLNTADKSHAIWMVESWKYSVNGHLMSTITNDFPTAETEAASLSSSIAKSLNGSVSSLPASSCPRSQANLVSRSRVGGKPTYLSRFRRNDLAVPLWSVLALFFDFLIRFLFQFDWSTPIDRYFQNGFTWSSAKDPVSGSFLKFEIMNVASPSVNEGHPILIGDLYEAVNCWLLRKWVGPAEAEEAMQTGFVASFQVFETNIPYARLILDQAADRDSLQILDLNRWTGGSWLAPSSLVGDPGGNVTELPVSS